MFISEDFHKSFCSMITSNDGFFKTDRQREYILSCLVQKDGKYLAEYSTSYRGNPVVFEYVLDEKGVVKQSKYTTGAGNVLQWERREDGKVSIQDKKEIARLQRLLKQEEKIRASRREAFESGSYDAPRSLYEEATKVSEEAIARIKLRLSKFEAT